MKRGREAALALASGLLLWLSFPNPFAMHFEVWPGYLAFVALVPFFALLEDRLPAEGFQLGFLMGSACFLPGLLWITNVKPLGLGAVPAWCGLAAYCALFPALFGAVAAWGLKRAWRTPVLWLAALWTLVEVLREHLFSGFPWLNLGSSQFANGALLPLAALTGQAGLGFAVVLVNAVVCALLVYPRWLLSYKRTLSAVVVLLALAQGARWQAGLQARWDAEGPPVGSPAASAGLKVAVVQGGIDEDQAWDRAYRDRVLSTYFELSNIAASQGARLIVWPESTFPGFFNEESTEAARVRAFAARARVSLLIGSTLSTGGAYTNGAVLVGPDGSVSSYAKRHLVPFGEYVPLRTWVPILDHLLDRFGVISFSAGKEPVYFDVDGVTVEPLVCYESVFPDLCLGTKNPDLIAILTDDTWYGVSSGPVWHAAQAVLRAVENGCWVARSASTGISLIAAPDGRIRLSAGLGSVGVLVQTIGPARPTPWREYGCWFLWLCAGILVFSSSLCRKTVKNS